MHVDGSLGVCRWTKTQSAWTDLTPWFFGLIGLAELSESRVLFGNVGPFDERPGAKVQQQAIPRDRVAAIAELELQCG